jgi:hypothetical protein
MAAEGQITSTIVKNAMLSSADAINAKFATMPMTFSQVATVAGNAMLKVFTPVIQSIGAGAQWIYDNWDRISPVIYTVGGAVAALVATYGTLVAIQKIGNMLSLISAARSALSAKATIADAAAKKTATGAQIGLNAALLASPWTWIILAIVAVIAIIAKWVKAVGGLKNAWTLAMQSMNVVGAAINLAWQWIYNGVATFIDWIRLGIVKGFNAMVGFTGDFHVKVLTILQNMVNGAIDLINKFISAINSVAGTSFDLIGEVTFATAAAVENNAVKQERADNLAQLETDINAARDKRDRDFAKDKGQLALQNSILKQMSNDMKAQTAAANSEAMAEESAWGGAEVPGYTAEVGTVDSVGSVGSIKDDINIAEEDLKFLRDIAEMRYVQNFVTLTPTVSMDAQINNGADLDEMLDAIERRLEDEFVMAAEGVYN